MNAKRLLIGLAAVGMLMLICEHRVVGQQFINGFRVFQNIVAATVGTPGSGTTSIYVDSVTKKLASKDDGGTITSYGTGGAPTAGFYTSVSGTAVSFNPFDRTGIYLDDKFCGHSTTTGFIGLQGWASGAVNGGSATVGAAAKNVNLPCGIKLSVTAVVNDGAYISLGGPATALAFLSDSLNSASFKPTTIEAEIALNAITTIRFYFGFASKNSTLNPSTGLSGALIGFDTTAGDTGWVAIAGDTGAVSARTPIAGTLDTNPHRLTITCLSSGNWSFTVDGGTPTTITQTISTGVSISPYIQIVNDATATTDFVYIYRSTFQQTGYVVN